MIASTFSYSENLEPLLLIGGIAALVAAFLTLVWLAVMALLPKPPVGSSAEEEIAFIAAGDRTQIARFLPTTLVAIAYVPTWLGLGALLWDASPGAAALAVSFGLLYPATTATGYWLQYTVVRGFAQLAATDAAAARTAYELIGFHDRPTSMSTTVVILGYTFWSIGGVAAGIALVDHGGGLASTTGILLLITAVLMFIGAAGHIARSRLLAAGVMASGVVSLAATVATAVLLLSQA